MLFAANVIRLYDLCLPGGLVVITTINERSVVYETARLLYCLGYKSPFIRLYHKHHVNHFNFSSLGRLLGRSRLSVLKILRHNLPLSAIDLSVSSKEYPKREKRFRVVKGILQMCVWGMFLLGRLTGRTFQQTMVAKK